MPGLVHDTQAVSEYKAVPEPVHHGLPELVRNAMSAIEYDDDEDLASRWFPVGKEVPIVVDPRLSAGLPVIKGRGVTVQAIHERFMAGLDIEFIADDFQLEPRVIQTAIRYSEKVAA